MNSSRPSLEQIFETHIQTLCLSLRPNTVAGYRYIGRRFFAYLRTAFPEVHRLSQLRRDPHLLSWFRWLSEQQPPLSTTTRFHYLIRLRRLLHSLPANHSIQPDFIRREDFPVQPCYLPRPLSLQEDQLLQQELRRTDNLVANVLLLMRATGIRIGECLDLSLECLRQLQPDRWALHVPLGKLHTERLVPADPELRQIVERILALRASAPPSYLAKSQLLLLPRSRRQNLGQNSSLGVSADREACRLFLSCHTAPLETFLCDRDAAAGGQPPGPDAAAWSQRHPHDLAVRGSHPAGFAVRIPPGPPECWPLTSAARARVPQRYPERRSPRYLSGTGVNMSSAGNVSPSVRQ